MTYFSNISPYNEHMTYPSSPRGVCVTELQDKCGKGKLEDEQLRDNKHDNNLGIIMC